MPFQVFDTVAWQGQGCHLLIAFCWVQFLEITSRYINHGADCINLIMQACVNDRKEMVALGFMSCDFALPLVEKVGLNKVSDLLTLAKRVSISRWTSSTLQPQILSWGAFCRRTSKHGQLVLMVVPTSDDSQWLHLLVLGGYYFLGKLVWGKWMKKC